VADPFHGLPSRKSEGRAGASAVRGQRLVVLADLPPDTTYRPLPTLPFLL
jgi:hypothetical protein